MSNSLVSVMNCYGISIADAARLLNVPEQSIVRWLLEDKMSNLLVELYTEEQIDKANLEDGCHSWW